MVMALQLICLQTVECLDNKILTVKPLPDALSRSYVHMPKRHGRSWKQVLQEASEAQLLYLFKRKFKSELSMAQLYHVKKEAERRMPANDFRHGRQQPVSMLFDRAGLVLQLDL